MYVVTLQDDEGCFITDPEFCDTLGEVRQSKKELIEAWFPLHNGKPLFEGECVVYECREIKVDV